MELKKLSAEELLAWRHKQLSKGGRAVDLDWLLDLGGGLCWSSLQMLFLDPQRSLKLEKSLEQLEKLWQSHLEDHIPLQHLIGRCPWRDFELEVNADAMIPRQETEILVDLALQRFDNDFSGNWVDLGTGSGALAIALARTLPDWKGHAVDCNKDALSLAKKNFKRLAPKSNVRIHRGNWWEPLKPWWGTFNLVVVNPPYIPEDLVNKLDPQVRDHEPFLALSGGPDGFKHIRDIISGTTNALSLNGWLVMEHHHDQSDGVLKLMKEAGLHDVSFEKDLHGIKRFAVAKHSPN